MAALAFILELLAIIKYALHGSFYLPLAVACVLSSVFCWGFIRRIKRESASTEEIAPDKDLEN
jgi:hypothetical protein